MTLSTDSSTHVDNRDEKIEALTAVIAAEDQRRLAEHGVFMACTSARCKGVTWQEIGSALGVTRQTAAARYGGAFR